MFSLYFLNCMTLTFFNYTSKNSKFGKSVLDGFLADSGNKVFIIKKLVRNEKA